MLRMRRIREGHCALPDLLPKDQQTLGQATLSRLLCHHCANGYGDVPSADHKASVADDVTNVSVGNTGPHGFGEPFAPVVGRHRSRHLGTS